MGWRSWRLPFQRGGAPGIIGGYFLTIIDAPEKIDNEWNLHESQTDRRPKNVGVQSDHMGTKPADGIGHFRSGIVGAAVGHAPEHAGHALGEHRLEDEVH